MIPGTPGNDVLMGTAGADSLFGADGDDELFGNEGEDYVDGENGRDTLHGGPGNDEMHGRNDDDVVLGNEGDDRIYGERGRDNLDGGPGNDTDLRQPRRRRHPGRRGRRQDPGRRRRLRPRLLRPRQRHGLRGRDGRDRRGLRERPALSRSAREARALIDQECCFRLKAEARPADLRYTNWVDDFRQAAWYAVRPAANRKPATYRCPLCGRHLPALSEHMLVVPEGDAGRRRHAHTACVMKARRAGRLPLREDVVPRRLSWFSRLIGRR